MNTRKQNVPRVGALHNIGGKHTDVIHAFGIVSVAETKMRLRLYKAVTSKFAYLVNIVGGLAATRFL